MSAWFVINESVIDPSRVWYRGLMNSAVSGSGSRTACVVPLVVALALLLAYGVANAVLPLETEQAPPEAAGTSNDDETGIHRINELRRDLLDYRANHLERWLIAVAIFITFLALLAAVFGTFAYREFRTSARELLDDIRDKSREAAEHARKMEDERRTVRARETDATGRELTPDIKTVMDQAEAEALLEKAREKWKTVRARETDVTGRELTPDIKTAIDRAAESLNDEGTESRSGGRSSG
jgi:multidrug efflux pump subunit AcrB